jgi:aminomethyltransferase
MKYYTGGPGRVADAPAWISRTGYTGEDGCELVVEAGDAEAVWRTVLDAGASVGALPVGLGARDTLRLEAAMPLYGHELSEEVNPVQAGLMFAVNLKGREFIGRAAIERFQAAPSPRRVGLALSGKRVAREGAAVLAGGRPAGEVTSGTFSPTLNRPIAMAYLAPEVADAAGQEIPLEVDIRGRREPASMVALPFYQRKQV